MNNQNQNQDRLVTEAVAHIEQCIAASEQTMTLAEINHWISPLELTHKTIGWLGMRGSKVNRFAAAHTPDYSLRYYAADFPAICKAIAEYAIACADRKIQ